MRFSPDHPDNILTSISSKLQVHSRKETSDRFVVKKAPIATYLCFSPRYIPVIYKARKKVEEAKLASYKIERQISEEITGSYAQCTFVQSQLDVDFAVTYKGSLIFADAKLVKTTINEFANYIKFLKLRVPLLLSFDELSEQARKSFENLFRFYKEWFSFASLTILHLVTKKYESRMGIGRGVEGYIPFVTWARRSLRSQLVNSLVFVDKLSQIKVC
jgi:hypothetical protein